MAGIPYQLVSILVWPACALMTYSALRSLTAETCVDKLATSACVGLLAMLLIPRLGFTTTQLITTVVTMSALPLLVHRAITLTNGRPKVKFRVAVLLAFSGLFLLWLIYLMSTTPVFGWDVIDYWGENAVRVLRYSEAGAIDPYSGLTSYTHPHTIINLNAISTSLKLGENLFVYAHHIPWLYSYITIAALIFSVGYRQKGDSIKAAFLAVTGCCTPLLEQHVISPGYAEIHLTACVMGAVVLFLRLCEAENLFLLLLFAIFIMATAMIKNSGILFSIVILSSAVLYALISGKSWVKLGNPMRVILLLIAISVSVKVFNELEGTVTFGSRVLNFSFRFTDIGAYFTAKYFTNMSFSILGASMIVALFFLLFKDKGRDGGAYFVAFVILGVEAMLTLSLSTDYGRSIAGPAYDIGNSRLTLPAVTLIPVLLALVIQKQIDCRRNEDAPG